MTVFIFLNKAQRFVTACFFLKRCSPEKDTCFHVSRNGSTDHSLSGGRPSTQAPV